MSESTFRAWWDIAQVLLLLYVVVTVPFRLGFDQRVDAWTFTFFVEAVVDLYFLLDIGVNFPKLRFLSLKLRFSQSKTEISCTL